MLIVWYPKNGGIVSSQKMKKRNKTSNAFNVFNMKALKHFAARTSQSSKVSVNI